MKDENKERGMKTINSKKKKEVKKKTKKKKSKNNDKCTMETLVG